MKAGRTHRRPSTAHDPLLLQEESEQQQNGGGSGNGGSPQGEDPKKGGKPRKEGAAQLANSVMDKAGVSLGPIGLTVGSELQNLSLDDEDGAGTASRPQSYASLTTAEWRALYEKDGYVDLWVEEEFNSGSRLVVSRGAQAGWQGRKIACWQPMHRVTHVLGMAAPALLCVGKQCDLPQHAQTSASLPATLLPCSTCISLLARCRQPHVPLPWPHPCTIPAGRQRRVPWRRGGLHVG